MVNSAKKFNPDHQHVDDEDLMGNKGKARFSELQNECGEKGFTIGVVNVNRLDFDQVTNFGGVKVISGMPVYVDILFMDKIVETSNEESTKKPPLVPKPEFIKEKE